jgi:hypothetical protein
MKDIYLNDFHREHSERLKKQLAQQPKASLEDAMRQYDRIKRVVTTFLRWLISCLICIAWT